MATYHITRRTILRHMLLRPDRIMTRVLLYLLAVITRRHGLEVHAFCAMSDHIHLVVTDVRGTLPAFLQSFHRTVALCTKALRQWHDALWDQHPTSVVRLETEAAIIEAIAYVLANPVTAGLVRHAHEWPGAKTLVDDVGQGTIGARRPEVYLNPKNPNWPESAVLPISLPPGIEPARAPAFRLQVGAELARLEAQAHAEMRQRGRGFLGAERASAICPTERATTLEPTVDRNPRFAVGRSQGEAWHRAASALRAFHASYRAALERWRAGARDAVFPPGTWWMRIFHCAVVPKLIVTDMGMTA
jgi:REP element-mobilizing transposase RayT